MMEKLDKVIAALEQCTSIGKGCDGCPYDDGIGQCNTRVVKAALELLKELDGKYRAALEVAAIATEKLPIRCKTCAHYHADTLSCAMFANSGVNWYEEDYCSYGAHMDEEVADA